MKIKNRLVWRRFNIRRFLQDLDIKKELLYGLVFLFLCYITPKKENYPIQRWVMSLFKSSDDAKEKPQQHPQHHQRKNLATVYEDEVILCVAYLEDFHPKAYLSGKRWIIGYGSSLYSNGTAVKEGDKIDVQSAQDLVRTHLRNEVFPYVDAYVKKPLGKAEFIGTCLFIYGIGANNFRQSEFLKALNQGLSADETARRMTGWVSSGGQLSSGLLKRSWIEAALYCGHITPYDLLELKPAGFYDQPVESFFTETYRQDDGYYNYNFSMSRIHQFLTEKGKKRKVVNII